MVHSKGRKNRRSKRTNAVSGRRQRAKRANGAGSSVLSTDELISKAQGLDESGDTAGALALLKQAVSEKPNDSSLCEEVALLYMQVGSLSEAEDMFRKAIELKPESGFEKYACLSQILGNTHEALELVRTGIEIIRKEAVSLGSSDDERLAELRSLEASAHCAAAEICLGIIEDSNDPETAQKMDADVESAVAAALAVSDEGSNSEIEAMLSLANLRLSQGRREEAVQSMKRILWRMSEGLAMLANGDNSDAVVVEALSKLPPLEIRIAVGKQFIEVEMWKPAIQILNSVMWECDFNVEVWYLLAVANWKSGDFEEARSALESTRAVLKNPSGYDGQLEEEMIDKLRSELDNQRSETTGKQDAMCD